MWGRPHTHTDTHTAMRSQTFDRHALRRLTRAETLEMCTQTFQTPQHGHTYTHADNTHTQSNIHKYKLHEQTSAQAQRSHHCACTLALLTKPRKRQLCTRANKHPRHTQTKPQKSNPHRLITQQGALHQNEHALIIYCSSSVAPAHTLQL